MVLDNTPQKSRSTSKSSLQEVRGVAVLCREMLYSDHCSYVGSLKPVRDVQPADLQEYSRSAQKRRRLSFGQSPVTPAKAENNPGAPAHSDHRPESPTLDLCHDGENFEADFELRPSTEIKVLHRVLFRHSLVSSLLNQFLYAQVLQRELKLIKQQLKSTKQANAQAEAEKEQADKEVKFLSTFALLCCMTLHIACFVITTLLHSLLTVQSVLPDLPAAGADCASHRGKH